MAVRVHQVIGLMERLAPRSWAVEGDNVGLLLGRPDTVVSRVVVALDLTVEALEEALAVGANLIVTHHPAIYRPLSALRTDLPGGALLGRVVSNEVAVFSAHTNLDVCPGGVSDRLAEALELVDTQLLAPTGAEQLVKLVVFVPEEALEPVRSALGAAGAGHLGNYSHCAFAAGGTGTFLPLPGAHPYVGNQGEVAAVSEVRLETIVSARDAGRVVKAMLAAHPYEEVAYDLYPLHNAGPERGFGRVGQLAEAMHLRDFAEFVKSRLAVPGVRVVGPETKPVRKVAVMGGSGGKFMQKAVFAGADAYVTGDVDYHQAQEAQDSGLAVIDAGHGPTERVVLESLAGWLREGLASQGEDMTVQVFRPRGEAFSYY